MATPASVYNVPVFTTALILRNEPHFWSTTPVRWRVQYVVWFAEALQLLLSLVSWTKGVSSLQASKKYVPAAILGTVTVTVPLEPAPGASEGTARLPLST